MTSIELLKQDLDVELKLGTKMVVNWDMYIEMYKQEIIDACGMALSKLLYQQAIEKQSSDELRKQQIIDAYEEGQKDTAMGFYVKSGETYYNNLKK